MIHPTCSLIQTHPISEYQQTLIITDGYGHPLITSVIEYLKLGGNPEVQVNGFSLALALFGALASSCYDDQLELFTQAVSLLLTRTVTFNECIPFSFIHLNRFSNVSCLQILYLYWKTREWDVQNDIILKKLVFLMISHPHIDIHIPFSNHCLFVGAHFLVSCTSDSSPLTHYHLIPCTLTGTDLFELAKFLNDHSTVEELTKKRSSLPSTAVPCMATEGNRQLAMRNDFDILYSLVDTNGFLVCKRKSPSYWISFWSDYLKEKGTQPNRLSSCRLFPALFQALRWRLFDENFSLFSELVDLFFEKGAHPNEPIGEINIGVTYFSHASCIHVMYAFWKLHQWNDTQEKILKLTFQRMLDHPLVNISETFSESISDKADLPGDANLYPYRTLFLLQNANLLHFASALGDFETLNKILIKNKSLIHSECSLVNGRITSDLIVNGRVTTSNPRGLIMKVYELGENQSGLFAHSFVPHENRPFDVLRSVRMTALHIAAIRVQVACCSSLLGWGAFRGSVNSMHQNPVDCLDIQIRSRNIRSISESHELLELLRFVPQLPNQPFSSPIYIKHLNDSWIFYDGEMKIPRCTYERLDKQSLQGKAVRKSTFSEDRELHPLHRSTLSDYQASGFHRGHLIAAANATASQESMNATFVLSNVAPFLPNFNQSFWKRLENLQRKLTETCKEVEMYSGTLFLSVRRADGTLWKNNQVVGPSEVYVPTHFYKVFHLHHENVIETRAYLMPHEAISSEQSIDKFETTLDQVQRLASSPLSPLKLSHTR